MREQSRLSAQETQLAKGKDSSEAEQDNMSPSLAKLQERLDLSEAELKKVVLRLPTLLSYSYESNISLTIDFIVEVAALEEDPARVRLLVLNCPAVLSSSLQRCLHPNSVVLAAALEEEGIELAEEVLCDATTFVRIYLHDCSRLIRQYCCSALLSLGAEALIS